MCLLSRTDNSAQTVTADRPPPRNRHRHQHLATTPRRVPNTEKVDTVPVTDVSHTEPDPHDGSRTGQPPTISRGSRLVLMNHSFRPSSFSLASFCCKAISTASG